MITTEEQLAKFTPQLLADLDALPNQTGGDPIPAPTPSPVPVPPAPPPAPGPGPGCLSIRALRGSWRMAQVAPGSWTLTQQAAPAAASLTIPPWFLSAMQKIIGAFLLTFVPLVITATTTQLTMDTLKAAAIAGLSAAIAALDTLVGNAITPGATGTVHAVRTKVRITRAELAEARGAHFA